MSDVKRIDILVPPGAVTGTRSAYRPVIPRGPLTAAHELKRAGFSVGVLDGYSYPRLFTRYKQVVGGNQPYAIGIGVHGAPSVSVAAETIRELRNQCSSTSFFVGGHLVEIAPSLLADILPPETLLFASNNFVSLGAALADDATPRKLISGFSSTYPVTQLDLSQLRPGIGSYFRDPDFEYSIETQYGCPHRCFHCGTGRPGLYARAITRDLDNLADELRYLDRIWTSSGQSSRRLWITDETFTQNKSHSLDVCQVLARRRFAWRAQTRVDAIDRETLIAMRSAGCDRIAFGVEVPTDDGLTLFGKRETYEQAVAAFRYAREERLNPEAIIVVGAPGDKATARQVLRAIRELGASSVQSYIYHPVPGSPWWRSHGVPKPSQEYLSALDFHAPPIGLSADETRRIVGDFMAMNAARSVPPDTHALEAYLEAVERATRCRTCDADLRVTSAHLCDEGVAIVEIVSASGVTIGALGDTGAISLFSLTESRSNIFSGSISFNISIDAVKLPCSACVPMIAS